MRVRIAMFSMINFFGEEVFIDGIPKISPWREQFIQGNLSSISTSEGVRVHRRKTPRKNEKGNPESGRKIQLHGGRFYEGYVMMR